LLGQEGDGIKVALSALDDGRMSLAASCTGLAQNALEVMTSYSQQREQFGKPIASFQLIQELISDTAVEVEAARLLTWRVADLKARGEKYTLAASMAKYYASAAMAMSMSSSSASCCATPASRPCMKAPRRCRSC
jgi:alkylation response protein AidB-like acyl-CoA dehydrogenase